MNIVKRILVFDDDPGVFDILRYILEEKGWEVISSDHCNDVVGKVEKFKPSIIMMDNNIPNAGGIVATQTIKKHQELKHIPVIFFTGSENVKSLAKQAGADAWLAKPFGIENLYEVIEKLLPSLEA